MPAAIRITRDEHTAEQLRLAASRCRNSAASRRMLALALILDGQSRAVAAQAAGMDRQTLRDWVHRYNERGLDGLANGWGGGRKALLDARQTERLAELVRQGPDPAEHGVVRWRRIDLARVLQAEFGVNVAERTVGTLLRRLGFRRISARPQHPKQDLAAQEAHKKTSPTWSPPASPNTLAASRLRSGARTRPGSVSRAP